MKTAVVTGGTVRLGKVIADRLRSDGWRVLTLSHRADSGADVIADLTNVDGVPCAFAEVMEKLEGKQPDAWINNAALFVGNEVEIAALNFVAPRKFTELMAARSGDPGVVINLLDARVLSPAANNDSRSAVYVESKQQLREYTYQSAKLYADTLRVNGVAPGPVLAPINVHEAAGHTPLGRPSPESVAAAVAFLLNADATTGCVIPVDGGQYLF